MEQRASRMLRLTIHSERLIRGATDWPNLARLPSTLTGLVHLQIKHECGLFILNTTEHALQPCYIYDPF